MNVHSIHISVTSDVAVPCLMLHVKYIFVNAVLVFSIRIDKWSHINQLKYRKGNASCCIISYNYDIDISTPYVMIWTDVCESLTQSSSIFIKANVKSQIPSIIVLIAIIGEQIPICWAWSRLHTPQLVGLQKLFRNTMGFVTRIGSYIRTFLLMYFFLALTTVTFCGYVISFHNCGECLSLFIR